MSTLTIADLELFATSLNEDGAIVRNEDNQHAYDYGLIEMLLDDPPQGDEVDPRETTRLRIIDDEGDQAVLSELGLMDAIMALVKQNMETQEALQTLRNQLLASNQRIHALEQQLTSGK